MEPARGFPGFDKLYELHDPLGSRAFRGTVELPNCGFELSRGESSLSEPPVLRWAMGTAQPGDVIWTTSVHPIVLSSRVVALLTAARLSGWTTVGCRVIDKNDVEHLGYRLLIVTGRCGTIDLRESAIVLKQFPAGQFPQFLGHYFDPADWDGHDFAVSVRDQQERASSRQVVTEAVVTLFKRNRVSNVRWVRLPEASFSTSNFEIGLQHLLPSDFGTRLQAAYREAGAVLPARYENLC